MNCDDARKQKIAAEMNLSETAFVEPNGGEEDADDDPFLNGDTFKLRWFTPTNEVPLCGHATMAAAKAIFSGRGNKNVRTSIGTGLSCTIMFLA